MQILILVFTLILIIDGYRLVSTLHIHLTVDIPDQLYIYIYIQSSLTQFLKNKYYFVLYQYKYI